MSLRWFAEALGKHLDTGRKFVLALVVRHSGSAPRNAGARMLVFQDGSIEGTVGGGRLELAVIQAAKELFDRGGTALLEFDLGRDLGMACGGGAAVYLELVEPNERVVVLGAGHIARSLCRVLAVLGLEVWVADGRPGFAVPEHFPEAGRLIERLEPDDVVRDLALDVRGDHTLVVVATHSHDLDFRLAERILAETQVPYVGMVASRKKAAGFRKRVEAHGLPADRLAALHSPVGLPLGGKSPGEIALSIAAEIQAFRHGRRLGLSEPEPDRGGGHAV